MICPICGGEMEEGGLIASGISVMWFPLKQFAKKGLERLSEADVKNISLTDFDTVVSVAADNGYIKHSDVERLLKFRANPSDESWIGGAK